MGSINLESPPYRVLYSKNSSNFSNLRDILSIPISTHHVNDLIDKPPWKTIFSAYECEVKNGFYTKNNNEVIELKTDDWDFSLIERLSSTEFTLCVVNINERVFLYSSICLGCNIIGFKYNNNNLYISFETSKIDELPNELINN